MILKGDAMNFIKYTIFCMTLSILMLCQSCFEPRRPKIVKNVKFIVQKPSGSDLSTPKWSLVERMIVVYIPHDKFGSRPSNQHEIKWNKLKFISSRRLSIPVCQTDHWCSFTESGGCVTNIQHTRMICDHSSKSKAPNLNLFQFISNLFQFISTLFHQI